MESNNLILIFILLVLVLNAELFTIRIYYIVDGIERMAGYVDYCCVDQKSRLELFTVTKKYEFEMKSVVFGGWMFIVKIKDPKKI